MKGPRTMACLAIRSRSASRSVVIMLLSDNAPKRNNTQLIHTPCCGDQSLSTLNTVYLERSCWTKPLTGAPLPFLTCAQAIINLASNLHEFTRKKYIVRHVERLRQSNFYTLSTPLQGDPAANDLVKSLSDKEIAVWQLVWRSTR